MSSGRFVSPVLLARVHLPGFAALISVQMSCKRDFSESTACSATDLHILIRNAWYNKQYCASSLGACALDWTPGPTCSQTSVTSNKAVLSCDVTALFLIYTRARWLWEPEQCIIDMSVRDRERHYLQVSLSPTSFLFREIVSSFFHSTSTLHGMCGCTYGCVCVSADPGSFEAMLLTRSPSPARPPAALIRHSLNRASPPFLPTQNFEVQRQMKCLFAEGDVQTCAEKAPVSRKEKAALLNNSEIRGDGLWGGRGAEDVDKQLLGPEEYKLRLLYPEHRPRWVLRVEYLTWKFQVQVTNQAHSEMKELVSLWSQGEACVAGSDSVWPGVRRVLKHAVTEDPVSRVCMSC
ncbi:hypothetical protein P4O66_019291 [Electrophorus voltai]|uniref:Uncharacterized protein n=1 Tax=Electrophorus voltai TaxID=2609070 RepID=A0AAD8ZWX7_9TELE|nr:hypothetical protein P4O66_019291 [Electrophorus voltai]